MTAFQRQVEEWKGAQAARLHRVMLPCGCCNKATEVSFDAPKKCADCGGRFLGRSYVPRVIGLLTVLFSIGVAWVLIEGISRS
jgi:hypothetical protein